MEAPDDRLWGPRAGARRVACPWSRLAARPMAYVLTALGSSELLRDADTFGVECVADAIERLAADVVRAWHSPRLERAVALRRRAWGTLLRMEIAADGALVPGPTNLALHREAWRLSELTDAAYRELDGLEAEEYLRRCRQVD
jgi:hypothetical protein